MLSLGAITEMLRCKPEEFPDLERSCLGHMTQHTKYKTLFLLLKFNEVFEYDRDLDWYYFKGFDGDKNYHIYYNKKMKRWECECLNFIYSTNKPRWCSHVAAHCLYEFLTMCRSDMRNDFIIYVHRKDKLKRELVREMRKRRKLEPKIIYS